MRDSLAGTQRYEHRLMLEVIPLGNRMEGREMRRPERSSKGKGKQKIT